MSGTYAIPNGWADSAPFGVAQLLRAVATARMGRVRYVLCTRTNIGRCHVWLHLPGRYNYRCINQHTHIVQSTCPKEFFWFVVVSILSVLHRFSPQFGYISLIVALPYSFIRGARFLPFLLCSSHFCYFVRTSSALWRLPCLTHEVAI